MKTENPGCLPKFLRMFGQKQPVKIQRQTRSISDLQTTNEAPKIAWQENESSPEQTQLSSEPPFDIDHLPYRLRDDFLSPAEASFFHVLHTMVGNHMLVFAKVKLSDLFFVSQREQNQAYWNRIDRKHVDFLLCQPQTLKPVLSIELDDSSHLKPDRIERDDFVEGVFRAAKLPLVRVPVQTTYNLQELGELFKAALKDRQETPKAPSVPAGDVPVCPRCGIKMVRRTASRGVNAGKEFFGCPNYPRCREIIQIAT